MSDRSKRSIFLICGLGSWALIFFAWLYLEKTLYMPPCPLCMMQRVAFGIVGFFFILNGLLWPQSTIGKLLMRIALYLSIFFGIGLAARHIYIQSLPASEVPACGKDFWGTLSSDGFLGGIAKSMMGTGDCAQAHTYFGLTLPMWSMLAFVILLIIAILFGQSKNEK